MFINLEFKISSHLLPHIPYLCINSGWNRRLVQEISTYSHTTQRGFSSAKQGKLIIINLNKKCYGLESRPSNKNICKYIESIIGSIIPSRQ